MNTQPVEEAFLNKLIHNYLYLEGNLPALTSFEQESGFSLFKSPNFYLRHEIRVKILSQQVPRAVDQINSNFPDLLDSNPDLMFELRFQAFQDLIALEPDNLIAAFSFLQEEFTPCPEHLLSRVGQAMTSLLVAPQTSTSVETAFKVNQALVQETSQLEDLISLLERVEPQNDWFLLKKLCKNCVIA